MKLGRQTEKVWVKYKVTKIELKVIKKTAAEKVWQKVKQRGKEETRDGINIPKRSQKDKTRT